MKTSHLFTVALLGLGACTANDTPAGNGTPTPGGDNVADASTADTSTPIPLKDAGIAPPDAADAAFSCNPAAAKGSFYELSSWDLGKTREVSMCEFRGKVVLVVNVASQCGYTPQYKPLEELYQKYLSQGLVVLGFPCNQFGAQEPGTDQDISTFCTTTYGITFPMFTKSNVNPPTENPIYTWLKAQPGGSGAITWNFNKFLLSRKGTLIKRYDSTIAPDNAGLDADVLAALAAK